MSDEIIRLDDMKRLRNIPWQNQSGGMDNLFNAMHSILGSGYGFCIQAILENIDEGLESNWKGYSHLLPDASMDTIRLLASAGVQYDIERGQDVSKQKLFGVIKAVQEVANPEDSYGKWASTTGNELIKQLNLKPDLGRRP